MHHWMLEYWNGVIGYHDTFLIRLRFNTAQEAIDYASKYAYKGRFYLEKITI